METSSLYASWGKSRSFLFGCINVRAVFMENDFPDWIPHCTANIFDSEGPQFTSEPSRLNYFTNVQSLILHCTARGSPSPRIQWITQKNGQQVETVIGTREVFPNGSLYFPPFPVSSYRPDVHDQVYVCTASNSVGKVRSRDIHVRAGT